jgi:acyl-CoA thioester hydrolase
MSESAMQGVEILHGHVLPEWIDLNDHMNVAYYVLAFDKGIDAMWAKFGITDDYIRERRCSTFAAETHVRWVREISEGDPYTITAQVLAYDAKRIHQFLRMYHGTEGYLAATAEWMNLHVDLTVRRVAPFADDILGLLHAFVADQGDDPWPAGAGSVMRVKKPIFSVGGGPA